MHEAILGYWPNIIFGLLGYLEIYSVNAMGICRINNKFLFLWGLVKKELWKKILKYWEVGRKRRIEVRTTRHISIDVRLHVKSRYKYASCRGTTTRGTTTRHNGIHRSVSARRREVLLRAIAMYYYASQRGWFRIMRFNQRARIYIDRWRDYCHLFFVWNTYSVFSEIYKWKNEK